MLRAILECHGRQPQAFAALTREGQADQAATEGALPCTPGHANTMAITNASPTTMAIAFPLVMVMSRTTSTTYRRPPYRDQYTRHDHCP